MKIRNCFSLADGTIVSGEELWQFFNTNEGMKYRNSGSNRKHLFKYFNTKRNFRIDRTATYIVEHREWHGFWGERKRIWFHKL